MLSKYSRFELERMILGYFHAHFDSNSIVKLLLIITGSIIFLEYHNACWLIEVDRFIFSQSFWSYGFNDKKLFTICC